MKKDKILINIENLKDIEYYEKIGINNFLFAVKGFSIGYKSFDLKELENIRGNKFLLINRIFNNDDCDNFKKIIPYLKGFNGIIFEDIAVYNMLKNENINLMWNQNHFATNYSSINYWLELTSSAVISNELTHEEVNNLLNTSIKPLVLNVFGKNPIMYSRRTLLKNFNTKFNLVNNNKVILDEKITNNQFKVVESDKGTFVFNNKFFNLYPYINNFKDDKILYYLIYLNGLDKETIIDIISGKEIENSDNGFMNKKTIYKLRGE